MTVTRQGLVQGVRRAYPANQAFKLGFNSCTIEVQTNHSDLDQALKDYFAPFVAPGSQTDILVTVHEAPEQDLGLDFQLSLSEAGKTRVKEEFCDLSDGRVVRKRLTGMVFVFGGPDNCAVGSCQDNLNQVVNFINNRYIQDQLLKGALLGHAAGVSLEGTGMALAGFSGMGKSTLALKLVEKGAVFVSNDRLLISHGQTSLIMRGVAKLPRINPGTALNNPCLVEIIPEDDQKRFSSLEKDKLWDLEQKYDVPIDVCFGQGLFKLSAPMQGLLILNWERKEEPLKIREVDLGTRQDLLPAFIKEPGLFYLSLFGAGKDFSPRTYLDLLSRCTVLEAAGGVDFAGAREVCLDFLQSHPG